MASTSVTTGTPPAGASSTVVNERRLFRSYRSIYEALDSNRPADAYELNELLDARLPKLKSCAEPFGKPSSDSRTKVESGSVEVYGVEVNVSETEKKLAFKISKRFDLDEIEAFILLRSYFQTEEEVGHILGDPETSPKTVAAKEGLPDDFIDAFYFDERVFLRRIVSALLRIIGHQGLHSFGGIAKEKVMFIFTDGFTLRLLDKFRRTTQQQLPEFVRASFRDAGAWAKQIVREQQSLLEVIFLDFYQRDRPDAAAIVMILRTALDTVMGAKQEIAIFFDAEANDLMVEVQGLLVLIAVEVLYLEDIPEEFLLTESPSPNDMMLSPEHLKEATEIVQSFPSDAIFSPIILAWSFLLSRVTNVLFENEDPMPEIFRDFARAVYPSHTSIRPDGPMEPPLWQGLTTIALAPDMQLFPTLLRILAPPLVSGVPSCISPDSPNALGARSVIKGLIMALSDIVRVEHVPDFDGLVDVWVALFGMTEDPAGETIRAKGIATLCVEFWQVDYEQPQRRALLEMARQRFPVQPRPLLRLLRALSGHAEEEDFDVDGPAYRCSLFVLDYFSSLPTIASVLPPDRPATPSPFSVISDGVFESVRPIPVIGGISVPPGVRGHLISEPGRTPMVVSWQWQNSGFKLVMAILDSLVGHSSQDRESEPELDNVFQGKEPAPTFFDLVPNAEPGDEVDVITDILGLIEALFSTGKNATSRFLDHVLGAGVDWTDDEGMEADEGADRDQDEGLNPSAGDLVSIVFKILERALSARAPPPQIVTSIFKILTQVLPIYSDSIWMLLRSSNIIIGAPGLASTATYGIDSSFASPQSTILRADRARGTYLMTLAYLDFVLELLADVRLSQLDAPTDVLQMKAVVLRRALAFVNTEIWSEYQSWRFDVVRQKFEIGLQTGRLAEEVLADVSLLRQREGGRVADMGPLGIVGDEIIGRFVTGTNSAQLAPLFSVLSRGQQQVTALDRVLRPGDVRTLESLIEQHLRLSRLILSRRLAALKDRPCLLERLFFDHATAGFRLKGSITGTRIVQVDLLDALFGYVSYSILAANYSIGTEASNLLTKLCTLTKLWQPNPPALVSYLGSPDDLEGTVSEILDVLASEFQEDRLKASIWSLLASIMDSQPALATLFITGRHLAHRIETQMDRKAKGKGKESQSPGLPRTALGVAIEQLKAWKSLWDESPFMLEPILRFVDLAWQRIYEHGLSFEERRKDVAFWKELGMIALQDLGRDPPLAKESGVAGGYLDPGRPVEVEEYCYRMLSRARAVNLLTTEIGALPRTAETDQQKPEPLKALLLNVVNQNGLKAIVSAAMVRTVVVNRLVVEAEMALMKSWRALFETSVPFFVAHGEPEKVQSAFIAAAKLAAGEIAEEEGRGETVLKILVERSRLLLVLTEIAITPPGKARNVREAVELLKEIVRVATSDTFSLFDSVQRLITPLLHRAVFSSILLVLRHIVALISAGESCKAERPDLQQAVMTLLNMTFGAVRRLFDVARTTETLDNSLAVDVDLKLLTAVLAQLIRPELGSTPSIWLAQCQEVEFFRSAFELLVLSRPVPLDSGGGSGAAKPLYTQHLLDLFLALTVVPQAAEQMALDGVMTALSSNGSLTPLAEAGQIASTDPAFPGERNPSHTAWCTVLAIVAGLIDVLGLTSSHFVEVEVVAFIHVYGTQLLRGLSYRAPGELPRPGEGGLMVMSELLPEETHGEGTFTTADLDEADKVARLFYGIAVSTTPREEPAKALQTLAENGLQLLSQYVYLLTHPQATATFLEPVTPEERRLLEKEENEADKESQRAGTNVRAEEGADWNWSPTKRPLMNDVLCKILHVSGVLVSAVLETSRATVKVLTGEPFEWPTDRTMVIPTARTSLERPASFGTLLDLASQSLDLLSQPASVITAPRQPMSPWLVTPLASSVAAYTLERSLTLIVTQMALWNYVPADMRTELLAVLGKAAKRMRAMGAVGGREKEGALGSSLTGAKSWGAKGPAAFIEVLHKFVELRLTQETRGGGAVEGEVLDRRNSLEGSPSFGLF